MGEFITYPFKSTQKIGEGIDFQGYLVLGFLSILDEKSRFGDRSYSESLRLKI